MPVGITAFKGEAHARRVAPRTTFLATAPPLYARGLRRCHRRADREDAAALQPAVLDHARGGQALPASADPVLHAGRGREGAQSNPLRAEAHQAGARLLGVRDRQHGRGSAARHRARQGVRGFRGRSGGQGEDRCARAHVVPRSGER